MNVGPWLRHERPPVVVAVGYDPMDAALRYAADEAARNECGLHLVHVVHHPAYRAGAAPQDVVDLQRAGNLTLDAARDAARVLLPGEVPVTAELLWDDVVPSLVEAAAEGMLVVLQRRALQRVARFPTGSVSSGVAARARVPVVSVPASWTPDTPLGDDPTVTVGVDGTERSDEVVRAALLATRLRGARLRVLHAWSFPREYDKVLVRVDGREEWAARATGGIRDLLARLSAEAAGLRVDVEVRCAIPSGALSEAGRTSELLVLGRHDPVVAFGSHIGPVARAVLRNAPCPVLLVDPRPPGAPDGEGRRGVADLVPQ